MTRYGLIIDSTRCTGCYACIIACKSENSTQPGVSWIRVQEYETGEFPQVSRRYMPLLCMQCNEMPCARVCPSEAIIMGDEGIVHIEPDRCGCRDSHPCIDVCPFDVLQVNSGKHYYFPDCLDSLEKETSEAHRDGVVEKCTLCSHRIRTGQLPACVQACPSKAMIFGDYDEPDNILAKLVAAGRARSLQEDLKLNPGVLYRT